MNRIQVITAGFMIFMLTILGLAGSTSGEGILNGIMSSPSDMYGFDGIDEDTPTYSKDGSTIYFTSAAGTGSTDIWSMTSSGIGMTRLTTDSENDVHPTPMGNDSIVFVRHDRELRILNVSSGVGWEIDINATLTGRIVRPLWTPGMIHFTYQTLTLGADPELYLLEDGDGNWSANNTLVRLTRDEAHQTMWSISDDRVYYHSDEDGGGIFDIWSMDLDGRNRTQITDTPFNEQFPQVTSDGRFIVYSSREDGHDHLDVWLMTLDGKNRTHVTRDDVNEVVGGEFGTDIVLGAPGDDGLPHVFGTSWEYNDEVPTAADVILLGVSQGEGERILMVDEFAGTALMDVEAEVTDDLGQLGVTELGYVSGTDIIYSLSDGTAMRRDAIMESTEVIGLHGRMEQISVSSDGSSAVYATISDDGSYDIMELDLGTGASTTIRSGPTHQNHPSYSFSGETIVYASMEDGGNYFDIWLYDRTTETSRQVTFDNINQMYPRFTADDLRIVYSSKEFSYDVYDICLMDLDGGSRARLPNFGGTSQIRPGIDSDGTLYYLQDGGVFSVEFDRDEDGVPVYLDVFPTDDREWSDNDGDGIGDNGDLDDDNDGHPDATDMFPEDPLEHVDSDHDGTGDVADTDDDNDGYSDVLELEYGTSPTSRTHHPLDTDNDKVPNLVDTDDDEDGHPDEVDAFPFNPLEWLDTDSDGIGDNSDSDDDADGVLDVDEPDHMSCDSGGNDKGMDFARDRMEWADFDGDCIGDNGDDDDDGDGIVDKDTDRDGIGNGADPDDDNDGALDGVDDYPLDASRSVRPATTILVGSSEVSLTTIMAALGSFVAGYFGMTYRRRRLRNILLDVSASQNAKVLDLVHQRVYALLEKNKIPPTHIDILKQAFSSRLYRIYLEEIKRRGDDPALTGEMRSDVRLGKLSQSHFDMLQERLDSGLEPLDDA